MFLDLIQANRSYRRFHQDVPVTRETLKQLVNYARLSPSARNAQPLKFMLANDPDTNIKIFPCLAWAGYLTDWSGPNKGEQPSAYIIILGDTRISETYNMDYPIAAQSILLGAAELGLGGCMLASIDRDRLREALGIQDEFKICLVIALGEPNEKIQIDAISDSANTHYWRDDQSVHHVPKRLLEDIIIKFTKY